MHEIFVDLLQQRGITPYQVAKATGVSNGCLSDWKRGRSTPKYEALSKIADYFGVSVERVLTGEKETAPGPQAESDLERRFRAAAAKLPPDFLEREIAYLEQKAQQLHVPTDSDM